MRGKVHEKHSLDGEIAGLLRTLRDRVDQVDQLPHEISHVHTLDAIWIYHKILRETYLKASQIAQRYNIPHNPRGVHTTLRRGECHFPRTKCEWMRRCQTRRCGRVSRGSPCGETDREQLECQVSGLRQALGTLPVAQRGRETLAFHRRLLSRLRFLLNEAIQHTNGFIRPEGGGSTNVMGFARLRPREVSALDHN